MIKNKTCVYTKNTISVKIPWFVSYSAPRQAVGPPINWQIDVISERLLQGLGKINLTCRQTSLLQRGATSVWIPVGVVQSRRARLRSAEGLPWPWPPGPPSLTGLVLQQENTRAQSFHKLMKSSLPYLKKKNLVVVIDFLVDATSTLSVVVVAIKHHYCNLSPMSMRSRENKWLNTCKGIEARPWTRQDIWLTDRSWDIILLTWLED